MGGSAGWGRRRFGLQWHMSLASVPAWSPIGAYASWYRPHVETDLPDVLHHVSPLVEAIEHHRRVWPDVESFDQFFPHLSFDRFDAAELMSLTRDAGASYVVLTAKHHDGLCWWDAPRTDRTVLHEGPARNVFAELVDAARHRSLEVGASYSLLDWCDRRYPGAEYVTETVHPHVLDLVTRFDVDLLLADGHWGGGESVWQSERLLTAARRHRPDLVVNDRWWTTDPDVRTLEYRMPTVIRSDPWELRRGLGLGIGLNLAESDRHLLDARGIVAALTECIAKGGSLTLIVGVDRHGTLPADHARRLRDAGQWITQHESLLERAEPWRTWGDDDVRYLAESGDPDSVVVIDVGGRGRFTALRAVADRIADVRTGDGAPVGFECRPDAVRIDAPSRSTGRPRDALPRVFRVTLHPLPEPPIPLFADEPADTIELAGVIAGAAAGDVVRLGEGTYLGPARIPDGVTVRGLGSDRTVIDGWESCAVVLGAGSRLEHCSVSSRTERIVWVPKVVVAVAGPSASLFGCAIDGHVDVDADDVRIKSCHMTGVSSTDHDRLVITRSTVRGMNWDIGIDITGGAGHVLDSNELEQLIAGVRLRSTVDVEIRGNRMATRWWGVHLIDAQQTTVIANHVSGTTRAVHVVGGAHTSVVGNAANDGDSGCLVEAGAVTTDVEGNHWSRCRIGLMIWEADGVTHHDNRFEPVGVVDARPFVSGPA